MISSTVYRCIILMTCDQYSATNNIASAYIISISWRRWTAWRCLLRTELDAECDQQVTDVVARHTFGVHILYVRVGLTSVKRQLLAAADLMLVLLATTVIDSAYVQIVGSRQMITK